MNDSEIIKALECCSLSDCMADCIRLKCPFFIERGFNRGCGLKDEYNGKRKLYEYALDLINRQQTYIERLQEYYRRYNGIKEEAEELRIEVEYAREKISQMEEFIITIKSETVREFAEKLKEVFTTIDGTFECWEVEEHIDNLVKEMAEGDNG